MKKEKIRMQSSIVFMIFCVSIFISVLINQTQAVNETNNTNTNNTGISQNVTAQQNTSNTTNQTVEKSNNARLSNLGIRPHDFTGFRYGTTYYEVVVPEDTETVEVYATAEDQKAKVTGTGKKTLEKGENKAEVVVTAEDGTTKTYTINIIRETQQENYDTDGVNHTEEKRGLAKLKIGNLTLSPEFKTNVYHYQVKYIGEDSKLEIEAEPTEDGYIVEVMGNENLQEGENFITILVSEEDGAKNVATYQITVNKSLVDEEAIASEKAQTQRIIIGVVVAIIVVIAMVVIFMMIHKRNTRLEEEFSGRFSYDDDENTDKEDDYEEEIPKALKGKRFREEFTEEIPIINKGFEENEEEEPFDIDKENENKPIALQDEEEDFEKMPKDELKEKFLNGYTSQMDVNFDFEDIRYQNNRKKGKHKGKRFK